MRSAARKTRGTPWGARASLLVVAGLLLVPVDAFAGRITLAWDPSPDPVAGYTIYWGASSGTYTASVNTTQTTHTIQGLTNGVRYYFVVKAFSSSGLYSAASNEVSGLPTNQTPGITNPGDLTVKTGPFSLAISASDPDGDALNYSATGLPSGLAIDASTGAITGTVLPGTYSITVTVNDGGAQVSTTFTLTVTPNNRPTVAAPPDQNNDTDDAVNLQLVGADPDGDPLTYSAVGLPAGLTVNGSSGLITGRPTTPGSYPVTVTVSDGALSADGSFTWTVVALPPPVPISRWTFDEGTGTTAADTAGARTGTLTNGALWTAGRSGSAVTLDGVDDYVAVPTFDVSGSAITIAGWVRNSSFSTTDQRLISKTTGTTNYWTLGTNASALRFRLRTGTSETTLDGGTLQPNTWYHAVATYDGATMRLYLNGVQVASTAKTGALATAATVPVGIGRNPAGSNYVNGAVDDLRIFARGLTAADVITLYGEPVIPPPNQPPSITNPGDRSMKTGPLSLPITASDPDGDTLTYSASGLPSTLSIDTSTATIGGTVAPGTYSITVTVSDGEAQASVAFILTVTPNNSPTLQAPSDQSHDTDDAVNLQLVANDPDGDSLTFSSTGLPAGLTLGASTGRITGTPTTPGSYPVAVTVSDGTGSASRTFTWTVAAASLPVPMSQWKFDDDSGTIADDFIGPRNGTLTNGPFWTAGRSGSAVVLDGINDHVGLPTFSVSGSAMTITAWIRNTRFTSGVEQRFLAKASGTTTGTAYWTLGTDGGATPRLRFRLRTGTTTTMVTASSGNLSVNTWYHAVATYDGATMRLYLNGVPVGSTAKTGTLATSASVPVSIGRNPAGTGADYLSGAIDDVRIFTRALTAAEVIALFNEPVVPPVNHTPVVTNPGNRTIRTGPFSVTIAASDADGDALTYTASGLPFGLSINASNGTISGTAAAGSYNITVTVSDTKAQSTATFTLTVTPNNSPTLQQPPAQGHDTDDAVSLQLVASDPDGDVLTFSAAGLPPGLIINQATGLITGVPTAVGSYPVTVGVTDGALPVTATFSWTVVSAASSSFTDDPLIPGVHVMRLVHLTEMRTRIDALRVVRGLSSTSWSSLVAGSTVIRASHIIELRNALRTVYLALGRPTPVFTDNLLMAGTAIKAIHIMELRAAILALE
jgi:hypothetical protein